MSKRIYDAFAKMFANYDGNGQGKGGVYQCPETLEICKRSAVLFAIDNPQFKIKQYLNACGVREEDQK